MNNFVINKDIKSECLYKNIIDEGQPDVSIVIPAYKRVDYLENALNSAVKQHATNLKYEVIVVSNDPEMEVSEFVLNIKNVNLLLYRNEQNIGMCGNINRCAELANGKYVAYLHDDDLLMPNYLKEIESYIREEQYDCIIPGRFLMFSEDNGLFGMQGKRKQHIKDSIHTVGSLFANRRLIREISITDCVNSWENCFLAPTCGTLFKRTSFIAEGGFCAEWKYAFDFIFFLKYAEKHRIALLHRYLGIYRMVDSASNRADVQLEFYKSFEEMKRMYAKRSKFIQNYEAEIAYFNYACRSEESKKLIKNSNEDWKYSKIKYYYFRIRRYAYYILSGLCNTKLIDERTIGKMKENGFV